MNCCCFFNDYFPYGMLLNNRHGSVDSDAYRYGFNGMERDDEVKGSNSSYDFGARMYDNRIGRWFAPDPLFSKYPNYSPYVGMGNNPIYFIDIDGRDIIIHLSNGTKITYKKNMKPGKDEFAAKVINALNLIHSTARGKEMIEALSLSNNNYNINETKQLVKRNPNYKAAEFALGADGEFDSKVITAINNDNFDGAQKILEDTNELFIGAFNGNYDQAWKVNGVNPDNVEVNFEIVLAHELFHGYQFELGQCNGNFLKSLITHSENGLKASEAQATGFENYIRGTLFSNTNYAETRASYSGMKIEEFYEPEKWYDGLFGGRSRVDINEFSRGGSLYKDWENEFVEPSNVDDDTPSKG